MLRWDVVLLYRGLGYCVDFFIAVGRRDIFGFIERGGDLAVLSGDWAFGDYLGCLDSWASCFDFNGKIKISAVGFIVKYRFGFKGVIGPRV